MHVSKGNSDERIVLTYPDFMNHFCHSVIQMLAWQGYKGTVVIEVDGKEGSGSFVATSSENMNDSISRIIARVDQLQDRAKEN